MNSERKYINKSATWGDVGIEVSVDDYKEMIKMFKSHTKTPEILKVKKDGIHINGKLVATPKPTTAPDYDKNVKESTPNTNCLKGVRCPRCGQNAKFSIIAIASFEVTDDGTDAYESVEWDDYAHCRCWDCNYSGKVIQFKTEGMEMVAKRFEKADKNDDAETMEIEENLGFWIPDEFKADWTWLCGFIYEKITGLYPDVTGRKMTRKSYGKMAADAIRLRIEEIKAGR